jgi:integrase
LIWLDILKGSLARSTRRSHLSAIDRLYEAAHRRHGSDCLDRLLADADWDAIEDVLAGLLVRLRNEAALAAEDRSAAWVSALTFVRDIRRFNTPSAGARMTDVENRLLRLDRLYGQLAPNSVRPPPPIRALPPVVIEDLYAIFDPVSTRNPFKSERLRWRNLLIFMLMLRLGLRRSETALLVANSIKDDVDPETGTIQTRLDVNSAEDDGPRYIEPGIKTYGSRRQIPVPEEILLLHGRYSHNYPERQRYPHLFVS